MKFRTAILFCGIYIIIAKGNLQCSENELPDNCKTPCEPTCQKPYTSTCDSKKCRPGCVCKAGTIRDEVSGRCVSMRYCPPACSWSEEKNNGKNGCERTCQNQHLGFNCIIQNKGCVCRQGLLRDLHSGKCIPQEHCPKVQCGVNEEWNICTNPISRGSCQSRSKKRIPQPSPCVAGCECKKDFIWDEYSKRCIPEYQCANACGENQEWKQCSDAPWRETCQNPKSEIDIKVCVAGCTCKKGYLWDENYNKCVPKQHCSKVCGENQEWTQCSDTSWRETCQRRKPKLDSEVCMAGCACKDGYLWDEHNNKCVPNDQCSKVCRENEEWCRSVSDNVVTCQNILKPQCYKYIGSFFTTVKPGCVCKEGFIWNELNEKCVSFENCLNIFTTTSTDNTTINESSSTTKITSVTNINSAATTQYYSTLNTYSNSNPITHNTVTETLTANTNFDTTTNPTPTASIPIRTTTGSNPINTYPTYATTNSE